MKNFIKNFYETVKVPETVNVATLHPPGVVVVELVPGATEKVVALGALTIIIPDPPPVSPPELPPPPPPPPVLTVPTVEDTLGVCLPPLPPPAPPDPGVPL